MVVRVEVAQRLKGAYRSASKAEKSAVLDDFCQVTGLGRSTARRYLTDPGVGEVSVVKLDRRRHKPTKYSAESKRLLVRLWRLEGMPCGKYMAANLPEWISALERHGELVIDQEHFTERTRCEVLAMSAATIDRYLKEERDRLELRGIGATKRGALLRNSIQIRTATQEVEAEPGFFEIDTVAHCGPTLKGEFARTLSMTDVHTGWIHLEVCRNNAQTHILAALNRAAQAIPFMIQGIDCDNGSEFINHEVLKWATDLDIFFTRSRPYQKNDQANIESKNNHVVRRYGFHYRYDTEEERQLLAALWQVVCLKMNFFTPTRKPIGWRQNSNGKRTRIYDRPQTPYQRLLAAGTLSASQKRQLARIYEKTNPAELTREILRYQDLLMASAREPTEALTTKVYEQQRRRQQRLKGGITIRTA